jgi:hypothetical protein
LITSVKKINKCSLCHCRPLLQKNLGKGSPFNVRLSRSRKNFPQLKMCHNCVKSYSSWNAFFCWLTAFGYSNNQREATLLQNCPGSEQDIFLSKITGPRWLELPIARTYFDSTFEFERAKFYCIYMLNQRSNSFPKYMFYRCALKELSLLHKLICIVYLLKYLTTTLP